MIRKVAVGQLKPGMYIHDLACEWMDHPFLRQRFPVRGEDDIRKIAAAGIHEVYIDTDKGLDLAHAPSAAEVDARLTATMQEMAVGEPGIRRTGVREEIGQARKVYGEAHRIVRNIMQDVRLGRQVQVEQVEPVVERITASILRNGDALLSLCRVKDKDDYTFLHSVSVCALQVAFCKARGTDADTIRQAGIGGLLHDIGKLTIPDAVLNKTGRLSDEEFSLMKNHVVASRNMLAGQPGVSDIALQVASQHHERYDGSGYPDGLKGEVISQMGQMAAICDVYDAITSDRCYHKGMAPTEALKRLVEWSAFHFNPALVHAFLRAIGIYPVGTLVRLESRKLAIVLEQGEYNLLQPKVRVVFDTRNDCYLAPSDLDLARSLGHGGGDRIVAAENHEKWGIDPLRFM